MSEINLKIKQIKKFNGGNLQILDLLNFFLVYC